MLPDRDSFFQFVRRYPVGPNESRPPSHWLDCQKVRHLLVIEAYARHRAALGTSSPRILDFGAYPGSLLKTLRLYLKEEGTLDGTGLAGPADFHKHLKEYQIGFYNCDLDPLIQPYRVREPVPKNVPQPESSYDVAFATEILEHLLDPLYLLREARRLLRPGGILIVTTPNQAALSQRLRLLSGRSIHHPLKESIMYVDHDWRPHIREYCMPELVQLLADGGFEILETSFINISQDDPRVWGWKHPVLRLFKLLSQPLMKVPSLRQGLLAVARVPNNPAVSK